MEMEIAAVSDEMATRVYEEAFGVATIDDPPGDVEGVRLCLLAKNVGSAAMVLKERGWLWPLGAAGALRRAFERLVRAADAT